MCLAIAADCTRAVESKGHHMTKLTKILGAAVALSMVAGASFAAGTATGVEAGFFQLGQDLNTPHVDAVMQRYQAFLQSRFVRPAAPSAARAPPRPWAWWRALQPV